MYFHGIRFEYLSKQYPILSPRLTVHRKNKTQLNDRRHLLEQFGIEPVHLLQSGPDYTIVQCVQSCFEFGDTVFAFDQLPLPIWRLSHHEVGVRSLDLRDSVWIFTKDPVSFPQIKQRFNVPVFLQKLGTEPISNKVVTAPHLPS